MFGRNKQSEKGFVEAILKGGRKEEWVIEQLFKKIKPQFLRYGSSHKATKEDLEDIFQNGLVIFLQKVRQGKFRGESKPSTFLMGICKNLLWNYQRKKAKMAIVKDDDFSEEYDSDNLADSFYPDLMMMNREKKQIVERFFYRMKPDCLRLLDFILKDLKMREIALRMGFKNAQIASNKKSTCFSRLKKELKQDPVFNAYAKDFSWKI